MEEICIENGYDERYKARQGHKTQLGGSDLWKGWCAKKSGQFSVCMLASQLCDVTQNARGGSRCHTPPRGLARMMAVSQHSGT